VRVRARARARARVCVCVCVYLFCINKFLSLPLNWNFQYTYEYHYFYVYEQLLHLDSLYFFTDVTNMITHSIHECIIIYINIDWIIMIVDRAME